MLKVLTAGALTVGVMLATASTAAADPDERITAYDVVVTVAENGTAHVTETIAYDFGPNQRHGLTRKVTGKKVTGDATASSPDGAPVAVTTSEETIRVGDPAVTVTGAHTYVLNYDVLVSAQRNGTDAEMVWHVVDGSWNVPMASVTAAITTPTTPTVRSCTVSGTTPCTSPATTDGNVIRVRQQNVTPRDIVLVTAKFSAASMPLATSPPPTSRTRPAYATPAAASSSESSGWSAFGWVIVLTLVGVVIALMSLAGKGSRSRSDGGYQSYTDTSSSSFSDSGSSGGSSDSGSSSSDSGGGSGSW